MQTVRVNETEEIDDAAVARFVAMGASCTESPWHPTVEVISRKSQTLTNIGSTSRAVGEARHNALGSGPDPIRNRLCRPLPLRHGCVVGPSWNLTQLRRGAGQDTGAQL